MTLQEQLDAISAQIPLEERLRHQITNFDAETREMLSLYQVFTSERPDFIAAFEQTVREVIAPTMRSFCAQYPAQKAWFFVIENISGEGGTVIYDNHNVPVSFQIAPPATPHRFSPHAKPHRFANLLEYSVDPEANIVVATQMSYRSEDRDHHSDTIRHLRLPEVTPLQVERDCSEAFHTLMTALRDVAQLAKEVAGR